MSVSVSSSSALFRALPSMNLIIDAFASENVEGSLNKRHESLRSYLYTSLPRPLLRENIESFLEKCRNAIRHGSIDSAASLTLPVLLPQIIEHVARTSRPHFRRVLNATGVVIHTNLGRSLLADEAVKAVEEAARSYSNLEFDLDTGARGSRYSHVEQLICRLTGAEAALVVNNNAAAVLLVLDTLCKGKEVIVSRGELVEIGGSFRIPEVMEKSGCKLVEVGATNRTHLKDYQNALTEQTAAIMKVHASNFRIIGFTKEVSREELAALAHESALPLLEDLGSGTLFDFKAAGLPHLGTEPTAAKVLSAGVDVVTFSGDKVLGGPQAGIIAGKSRRIDSIKKNPMNRALRIDKLTLAALEATLRLYLDPDLAKRRIPTLRMLCMDAQELEQEARRLRKAIAKSFKFNVIEKVELGLKPGMSRTGGGAFPEYGLPTTLVTLNMHNQGPDRLRKALLESDHPVVARVEEDALCLDPRTLTPQEYPLVAQSLCQALLSLQSVPENSVG